MTGTAITVFIVIGIPVICATAIAIAIILKGKSGGDLSKDETRLLQEIHQGLGQMEKRIEALESIVIEREKHHEHTKL